MSDVQCRVKHAIASINKEQDNRGERTSKIREMEKNGGE
jgi:hypothetical protein